VAGEHVVEGAGELAVTVTNEEPRPARHLLDSSRTLLLFDHPGPVRMIGDADESNFPGMKLDENKT
jgi:hypothetical protein